MIVCCVVISYFFFVECQLRVSLIYRRENSGGGTRTSGDLNAARKKRERNNLKISYQQFSIVIGPSFLLLRNDLLFLYFRFGKMAIKRTRGCTQENKYRPTINSRINEGITDVIRCCQPKPIWPPLPPPPPPPPPLASEVFPFKGPFILFLSSPSVVVVWRPTFRVCVCVCLWVQGLSSVLLGSPWLLLLLSPFRVWVIN